MSGKSNLPPGNSRCDKCGFRIRGSDHKQGPHHKSHRRNGDTDPKKLQQKKRW